MEDKQVFSITLQKSGKSFLVAEDESILDAALKQGIILAYGCKNGACGSCKAKVIEGEFAIGPHSSNGLTDEEAARNIALLCCTTPKSNCIVDAREIDGASDYPIKKIPCRVANIEKLTPDVISLKLQLPSTEKFRFIAGQYVEFLLKDGKRRAYSIATAPHEEGPLELHIRHMPGGLFTDHVFGVNPDLFLKEKDILRFEGPMGSFFLREESDKPIIFIASGTGFAPIQSIIEHIKANKIEREMYLYWGGRRPSDIYYLEKCVAWTKELPNLHFIPVVSDALPEDNWTGRTGFVHAAAMQDIPDMSDYQVYACGAPIVINSASRDFVAKCNLPEDEFYADSFTSEADLAKQT